MQCRLLMWRQDLGPPGKEISEALCAAVEPVKTAERQPQEVQIAFLQHGK